MKKKALICVLTICTLLVGCGTNTDVHQSNSPKPTTISREKEDKLPVVNPLDGDEKITVDENKVPSSKPINNNEKEKIKELLNNPDEIARKETSLNGDIYSLLDCIYANRLETENVILSDTSLKMALKLLTEGSNNETRDILLDYLGYSNIQEMSLYDKDLIDYYNSLESTELNLANSVWTNKNISLYDSYIESIKNNYYATASSLDFSNPASADIINKWCSDKTNGLINEIIDAPSLSINENILINALYFNGTWKDEFVDISNEQFTNIDGSKSDIEMMNGTVDTYFENENATGFAKYYYDNIAFIGILPKEEGNINLSDLDIDSLIDSCDTSYDVRIKLPKFRVEDTNHLETALADLGLENIFSSNADFSNMTDERLYVDEVIQKTYVDVNETGTEAAAVTSIRMKALSMPMPKPEVEVYLDRPFVFMIYDFTNDECLFIGKINTL